MTSQAVSRRDFISSAAASASALTVGTASRVWSANETISMGIIGTGGRGCQLLKTFEPIQGIRFIAVCDLIQERADRAAAICEEFGPRPKTYLDFREMLGKEKLDACIVATEEYNHAKCVVPVLEAGLHCFSEKPVDVSVEKVVEVVKAARKAKGIYQIGFQRRYAPNFLEGMKIVHSGEMGKITFMQGCWQFTWDLGGRYIPMEQSGSWLLSQACHHIDVFQWVMKDQLPEYVSAMGACTVERDPSVKNRTEDHSGVLLHYPGDINCAYTHLMYCCEAFSDERLWVHAEKGGVDLRLAMKYPRPGMGDPLQFAEPSPNYDQGTPHELRGFVDHIRKGEQPLSNIENGAKSSLVAILACNAMFNWRKHKFEPSTKRWKDLKVKLW